MRKNISKPSVRNHGQMILFLTLVLLCLFASAAESADKEANIVTIWNAPKADGSSAELDFSRASRPVQMQRRGFERGIQAYNASFTLIEHMVSEQSAIEAFSRELADLYNSVDNDRKGEILIGVGASTDLMTMYAAMETDFFNVPFLIPFADGALSDVGGTGFSLRMTPTTETYAAYFSQSLIPPSTLQNINMILFENSPLPPYSIDVAVFYDNNYNGNANAVAITQNLMDSGMNIELYVPFSSGSFGNAFNAARKDNSTVLNQIDIVLIIGEQTDEIAADDSFLSTWSDRQNPPAVFILGFGPGRADSELVNAENVYFIRQAIDMSNCPADIISYDEAMGYAAGYLMCSVLDQAVKTQKDEPAGIRLWFRSSVQKEEIHEEYVTSFRNSIRSGFLAFNGDIPCFGHFSFGSAGTEEITLELVRYTGMDTTEKLSEDEIFTRLLQRVSEKTGTPYQ